MGRLLKKQYFPKTLKTLRASNTFITKTLILLRAFETHEKLKIGNAGFAKDSRWFLVCAGNKNIENQKNA